MERRSCTKDTVEFVMQSVKEEFLREALKTRGQSAKKKYEKFLRRREVNKKNSEEFKRHLRSMSEDSELFSQIWQLVPKESLVLVERLLKSIIHRMLVKSLAIEPFLPLFQMIRKAYPERYERSRIDHFKGEVSDEELCLELRSVVEQNSAALGESCVNSIVKLLDRFMDISKRLKELQATAERHEKELEEQQRVRAGVQNLELSPASIRTPGVDA